MNWRYVLIGLGVLLAVPLCVFAGHHLLAALARIGYESRLANEQQVPRTGLIPGGDRLTVRNPISETGQDPWIAHVAADSAAPYHYVYTEVTERGERLYVKRAPDIFGFDTIAPYFTWDPRAEATTAELQMLWAPELHQVDGHWVIYVAANSTNSLFAGTHRMHALVAHDDADLGQGFLYMGELELPGDRWAIDGTYFRHAGQGYFVWSGWAADEKLNQRLYICRMDDALTPAIGEPAVEISRPTYDWELRGRRLNLWPSINEGPVQLQHAGRNFLVYAASGSWSDYYCLGLLELTGDDPLDPAAWTKHPEPVLAGRGDVIAPGHNSFLRRGDELLCVYHAAKFSRAGWDREVHIGVMDFDERGWPVFPEPKRGVVVAR